MTETLIGTRPNLRSASPIGDIDGILVCRQVQTITHDVKMFVLAAAEDQAVFRYHPGQYLTVTVDVGGKHLDRCYTISSPPTRPDLLAITVKRMPNGPVSGWLHGQLRPGDRLHVQGPFGQFSIAHHPAPKYLFLSAGSGITPLMSMTRTMFDLADPADILFVHNARTPSDLIFRHELQAMAATSPTIRVVSICEADSAAEHWPGHRGRLTRDMLALLAPDLQDREIFACGPTPYMAAIRSILADLDFDTEHYHQESFNVDELPARLATSMPSPKSAEATTYSLQFTRSGRTITCDTDTYILDAALAAGLAVPSSCGQGMCGTCKTTLTSGTVDMAHQGGIRPREITQGKILLCCSKPLEPLVIDA